jgi:5-formyltetrahydrofolate cyclo-ligase
LDSRNLLRKTIRDKRLAINSKDQKLAAKQLLKHLTSHPKITTANNVAIYLANDGELDTTPFIEWCWANNKQVYLPVIHPFSKGHLLFLHYTPNATMCKNRFGILEPKLNVNHIMPINEIDILFTPLVAFDKQGARLGMGGGFYDRSLEKWHTLYQKNNKARPYPIGLAHNCQRVDSIPTEHWDIPIPEFITPTNIYRF